MLLSSTGGNCTVRREEGLDCGLHCVYYRMRAAALTPSPTRVGAPNHKVPVRGECSAALNHSGNKPPPIISMRKCHRVLGGGGLLSSTLAQQPLHHHSPPPSRLLSVSSVATSPHTPWRQLTEISKSNAAQFLEALGKINDDRWRFFFPPWISLVFGWAQINKLFKWKERGEGR